MDINQFTAPFDLERFKSGEPAVFADDLTVRTFSRIEGSSVFDDHGGCISAELYERGVSSWNSALMRPTQKMNRTVEKIKVTDIVYVTATSLPIFALNSQKQMREALDGWGALVEGKKEGPLVEWNVEWRALK